MKFNKKQKFKVEVIRTWKKLMFPSLKIEKNFMTMSTHIVYGKNEVEAIKNAQLVSRFKYSKNIEFKPIKIC